MIFEHVLSLHFHVAQVEMRALADAADPVVPADLWTLCTYSDQAVQF